MRKLGSDHKLVFLAPDEVIKEIKRVAVVAGNTVDARHVLQWTMRETCNQLQTNVVNWKAQGYAFAVQQTGWDHTFDEKSDPQRIQRLFCQKEGKSLEEMYGLDEDASKDHQTEYTAASKETIEKINQHCQNFDHFSLADARVQEQQEVELAHEQEVEREIERPPPATPAVHFVHKEVTKFINTGVLDRSSSAFRSVGKSFEGSSLVLPLGGEAVFRDLVVSTDFYHTIKQIGPHTKTDDFLRPVEWLITTQELESDPGTPDLILLSPYEVEELLPLIRVSNKIKLHLFAPRTSASMLALDELRYFTLPTGIEVSTPSLTVTMQLNLYSGTLFLSNIESYKEMCQLLRLYLRKVRSDIAGTGAVNSNGFVNDPTARKKLKMTRRGFEQDPTSFFRALFQLRRNGRTFRPSHMGKILFGQRLSEDDFKKDDDTDSDGAP